MRVVVTGAAGFVGSHLVEALVETGHEVVAVDCMLADSYDPAIKRRTFERLEAAVKLERDLRVDDLRPVLEGADAVVNEAAMPGLMKSWSDFDVYVGCNLLAVDRLLAASREAGVRRFVQISTSSVYGEYAVGDETLATRPFSPYGVSKLAAESLVQAHIANFGIDAVILRYFSLYGPRQRPDMGYHRFCEALLDGRTITVYGDGRQTRTNTHVRDAVAATVAALGKGSTGDVFNVSGSQRIDVLAAIDVLAQALGTTTRLEFAPARPGDQRDTAGDTTRARHVLGWTARTDIVEGLREQAQWHLSLRSR